MNHCCLVSIKENIFQMNRTSVVERRATSSDMLCVLIETHQQFFKYIFQKLTFALKVSESIFLYSQVSLQCNQMSQTTSVCSILPGESGVLKRLYLPPGRVY